MSVVGVLIISANLSCYELFSALEVLQSFFFYFNLTFPQVIAAEGEQKASRALREASEVIAESSSALQLRYLQVKKKGESGYHIPTWGGGYDMPKAITVIFSLAPPPLDLVR